jgi:hypothetical protein
VELQLEFPILRGREKRGEKKEKERGKRRRREGERDWSTSLTSYH